MGAPGDRSTSFQEKEMSDLKNRPQNREVENEMICPPAEEGKPPRPVTEPKPKAGRRARQKNQG